MTLAEAPDLRQLRMHELVLQPGYPTHITCKQIGIHKLPPVHEFHTVKDKQSAMASRFTSNRKQSEHGACAIQVDRFGIYKVETIGEPAQPA